MELSIVTWYVIIAILTFVGMLWLEWFEGADLTIGLLILSLIVSILPVINLIILSGAIARAIDQHLRFTLIKGRVRK
jgi:hypothetical protein